MKAQRRVEKTQRFKACLVAKMDDEIKHESVTGIGEPYSAATILIVRAQTIIKLIVSSRAAKRSGTIIGERSRNRGTKHVIIDGVSRIANKPFLMR